MREIDGVAIELISGFSRRRTQVEAGYDRLVADYVARYGHTPPRSAQMQLAQQATLADRPDKQELKTLAEQISEWRALISRDITDATYRTLDEFDIENREQSRDWVRSIQRHLRLYASSILALEGFVITAMLNRNREGTASRIPSRSHVPVPRRPREATAK